MSQISVNGLTFCYEGSFDNIFEDTSFAIDTDWKLGFIGRNGKGKTTFLRLLLGEHTYTGSIDCSVRFGYFPYLVTEEQLTRPAEEFMEELRPGYEGWRVICELSLLGEDADTVSAVQSAEPRAAHEGASGTAVFRRERVPADR